METAKEEVELNEKNKEELEKRKELELGSEEIDLPSCDPCSIEGSQLLAVGYCKTCGEYLCNQCYGYHCKPKPMRHHVLLDSQNMPKSNTNIEQSEDCQEKCRKHEGMSLKIYCRSHNDLGCILCLSDDHAACKNVSFIQDCAKDISGSKEYKDFQKELKTLETNFSTQLDVAKSEGDAINEMVSTVKTSDVIQEVKVLLDKVRTIDVKIDDTRKSADQMLEYVQTTCKEAVSELQKFMSDKKSDTLKFVNMKRGQAMVWKVSKCLEKLKAHIKLSKDGLEKLKTDIKLSQEKINQCDLQKSLSALRNVEKCCVNEKETAASHEIQYSNIEVISKHCCNVKVDPWEDEDIDSDDEVMDCRITGSAILTDGRLAFVDFCNKSVKIFSPPENHVDARLRLSSKPFDAAEIHQGRIVVTVPSSKKIYQLSLDESELKCDTTFKTNGTCHGICCDQNVLYVAFENPPKIEIMDMKGTVLKSFVKDSRLQSLFSSPWYVAHSPMNSRLYVTDREKDTVTCLTTQGEVVSVYKTRELRRPYGITVDSSGTVYVCARRTDSIYCLTPDFRPIRVIEDDSHLHKPESIACWNKTDRLYVGLYRDDEISVLDIHKR